MQTVGYDGSQLVRAAAATVRIGGDVVATTRTVGATVGAAVITAAGVFGMAVPVAAARVGDAVRADVGVGGVASAGTGVATIPARVP